jgi:hypothetical protein
MTVPDIHDFAVIAKTDGYIAAWPQGTDDNPAAAPRPSRRKATVGELAAALSRSSSVLTT